MTSCSRQGDGEWSIYRRNLQLLEIDMKESQPVWHYPIQKTECDNHPYPSSLCKNFPICRKTLLTPNISWPQGENDYKIKAWNVYWSGDTGATPYHYQYIFKFWRKVIHTSTDSVKNRRMINNDWLMLMKICIWILIVKRKKWIAIISEGIQ